jgi:hypothetical protein
MKATSAVYMVLILTNHETRELCYTVVMVSEVIQASKKRSSTIASLCLGEYQAVAFAEPRTLSAQSIAKTESSTRTK